jgi:GAF domain-containing protein
MNQPFFGNLDSLSQQELFKRFVLILSTALFVITLVVISMEIAIPLLQPGEGLAPSPEVIVEFGVASLAALFAVMIALRGATELASGLLTATLFALTLVLRFTGHESYSEPPALLTLIAAATLGSTFWYFCISFSVFGIFSTSILVELSEGELLTEADPAHDISLLLGLMAFSFATRYVITALRRSLEGSSRNQTLMQTSAEIAQFTTRYLNLTELLNEVVDLIRDRFQFYHVQVFLVNEAGDTAELVASTGEVGKRLLARKHSLPVGSQSVIGQVTRRGESVVARNTQSDPTHARNELLPDTRAELALPITDGDQIIGALDVQSTIPNAFGTVDIRALQVVANVLANAIRNARLFETQGRTAQENKRLYLEAESALAEIERLNRRLTRESWERYLAEMERRTGVTLANDGLHLQAEWTEELTQAGQQRRPVTRTRDENAVVAVPLVLRGEVIGAIEVEPGSGVASTDTVEMMQAVAQRLALSLDNARLFEEAQEATVQEQRINELVARYQTVMSVDELLKITLSELSESLGAQRGAIRLGKAPQGVNGHA